MAWIGRVPSIRRRTTSLSESKPFNEPPSVCVTSARSSEPSSGTPPPIKVVSLSVDHSCSMSPNCDLQPMDMGLKNASMMTLVEMCVQCFDGVGDQTGTTMSLPKALFLVHKWFMSSAEFAKLFVELYSRDARQTTMDKCPTDNCEHGRIDCPVYTYKGQLCRAINYWVQAFPMHFDVDEALRDVIDGLRRKILQDGYIHLSDFLDTSTVPSYAWMRNISVRNPTVRQCSLSFDSWSPEDIANSLTHYERRILRRIAFSEYKIYAATTSLKNTPTLERSIAIFNSVSQWVQCMVLNKPTPQERADIMMKFINVAKRLRKIQNFNTLMAIVGGLSHSAIARLAKTHECLTSEAKKDMADFTSLLSSAANFSNYRKILSECKGSRIPIVGVHLKDLISLHAVIPDLISDQINCKKLAQLAIIFAHLILDLEKVPNIPEGNPDFVNLLKVYLDIPHSEDEIYNLSVRREPRSLRNCYNSKTAVFADWAAGVSQVPDQETINKHVTAMVEAVFKHYDHDKDGYISQQEFQSIVGSFPFIDSFGVLDADQDGMISKTEMIRYFVQANTHSIAFRRGFQHNFHETTFLTPTSCLHCGKVLWGLLRQGVKCKDCGTPVHRACKDSLVAECRRRTPGVTVKSVSGKLVVTVSSSGPPSSGDDSSDGPDSALLCLGRSTLDLNCPFVSSATRTPVPGASGCRSSRLWPRAKIRQSRTVSTVSPDSPTPDIPAVRSPFTFTNPVSKINKFKRRSLSESVDCYRCNSPGSGHTIEVLPSLASEEVFEEELSVESNDEDNDDGDDTESCAYGDDSENENQFCKSRDRNRLAVPDHCCGTGSGSSVRQQNMPRLPLSARTGSGPTGPSNIPGTTTGKTSQTSLTNRTSSTNAAVGVEQKKQLRTRMQTLQLS